MLVVRHADPAAFLAAARAVIARDEAEGMMIESRVRALLARPAGEGGRVYLATTRGRTRGAAFQLGSHPLSVGASDGKAGAAFADDLVPDLPALSGVYGMRDPCEHFLARWKRLTGRGSRMRFRLRHHILTEVSAVPAVNGAPRVASAADVPWLVDCQQAFIDESGVPDSPVDWKTRFERGAARGLYWIWDDGGAVSFVGWMSATPSAARIAPVYTVRERRGRGYATALVASLARSLLDAGVARLSLTTDIANPVSNAVYARIGFRPTSEGCHFDIVDGADG